MTSRIPDANRHTTEQELERADGTGHTTWWNRETEKQGVTIVRDPEGQFWSVADTWRHRMPFGGDPSALRQHGRVTNSALLHHIGLIPEPESVGPFHTIHVYAGTPRAHHGYRQTPRPVAVDLGLRSPTARAIGESIINTLSRHPGSTFIVEDANMNRDVWGIQRGHNKWYDDRSIYRILEWHARLVDEAGLRVIGPGWEQIHGFIHPAAVNGESGARALGLRTTAQVADDLGVTPGRIRQLAAAHDIGWKGDRDRAFNAEDIERISDLLDAMPKRRPRSGTRAS